MRKIRCAIYTRKSSEEGLEQAFNSLDAQREACAAYVLSQASEGWTDLPEMYDDGGLSGGSLQRPALERLLGDIAAGKIDIVVVYKVDRLTRSLLDFSKLVEMFDKAGVSFVSVTQSFNTTNSMGRLTLNMLLSFAQFEREVTAERIRDKIAASKAKGMWMGGVPPLGYAADGRTLKIMPEHAEIVRHIYKSYLELGNVRLVSERLNARGVVSPLRSTSSKRTIGGKPFSRGQLYFVLKSPIYVGDIPHGKMTYAGRHAGIIDRDTWTMVQSRLAEQTKGDRPVHQKSGQTLLAGKVVDGCDNRFTVSHTCNGTRRYRYYVGPSDGRGFAARIPAPELHKAVAECAASALDDPIGLMARACFRASSGTLGDLTTKAVEFARALRGHDYSGLRSIVEKVRILDDGIEIECATSELAELLMLQRLDDAPVTIRLSSRARPKRSGHVTRLVDAKGGAVAPAPSPSLLKLLVKSRRWWGELRKGEVDVTALARREGVSASYVTRVVRLAFLSPSVVEALLAGRVRSDVDGMSLTVTGAVDPDWNMQAARLLPS